MGTTIISGVLKGILEGRGYRVSALSQLGNLEELIQLRADLFLIDELLPVIKGHTFCIVLKYIPETKAIPLVLISSCEQLETIALLCEADGFLLKRFTQEQISNLLRQCMPNPL